MPHAERLIAEILCIYLHLNVLTIRACVSSDVSLAPDSCSGFEDSRRWQYRCIPRAHGCGAFVRLVAEGNRRPTMDLDPVLLSRLQFAWVIGWHILLPAFTVGMASYIAILEGMHLVTGRSVYLRISMYWIRIFSVAFGVGVVTGVIMPFQFGTNWSRYADTAGNVLGPLFAYEALTAFFLEAAFLGVLLFGRKLVPPWAHFVAALMIASGTLFSSFWILSANSWMQTPAGYEIVDGRFFVTTGFVVVAVAAWLIRKGRSVEEGRVMLSMTLWLLTFLVPLQMFLGDQHGLNTAAHQPAKVAAIEARWDTQPSFPLTLFAIPAPANETNRYAIEVPYLGSLILTHSLDGAIKGLKEFKPEDRPPVAIPFFAFRIMVGIGLLMLAVVAVSWWLRYRDRLFDSPWFLWLCMAMGPLGFIAVLAGWTTTEVGRQPWTVYGMLRTADSTSPSLVGGDVLVSLLAYMVVYLIIYPSAVLIAAGLVRKGSALAPETVAPIESGRPRAPIHVELVQEGKTL